jgi:predicted Zn-dependent peptidase
MVQPPGRNAVEKPRAAGRRTLDNGMTMISETDGTTATTAVQILVRGGKRAQPAGQEGLAFLATRLAVEIPDENKVQDLIGMASGFQVGVKGDYSFIQLECLSVQLEATLKIVAKIVSDPLFSGLRIDSVKRFAEHQGRIEEDDSVRLGHLAALQAFSGTPGYGGSVYGDKTTLSGIKGKDISEFYKKYFVAANMILAVSSDRQDAAGLVEKAFGGFPPGPAPSPPPAVFRLPGDREISLTRETQQAFIAESFKLPELSPRNYALGLLLESILGKGPGSRLWALRTEKRLAYNVNAVATQMMGGGMIEAYLETDKNKKLEAREALRKVLADVWESGVTDGDLRAARVSVWGAFLRDNEVRPARTLNLAAFEATGLGLDLFYGLRKEL